MFIICSVLLSNLFGINVSISLKVSFNSETSFIPFINPWFEKVSTIEFDGH